MGLLNPPDPNIRRSYELVGEFMSSWALVESALNRAIHKLCGLSGLAAYAVTSNMGVRDKTYVVRTMLHLALGAHKDLTKSNNTLMDEIVTVSGDRNLVAHTPFSGVEAGVSFFVIKAKGKFDLPDTLWTLQDFADRNAKSFRLSRELTEAVSVALEWRRATTGGPNALLGLMTAPKPAAGMLGNAFAAYLHAQAVPDARAPKYVKYPRTRKPPRPKKKPSSLGE